MRPDVRRLRVLSFSSAALLFLAAFSLDADGTRPPAVSDQCGGSPAAREGGPCLDEQLRILKRAVSELYQIATHSNAHSATIMDSERAAVQSQFDGWHRAWRESLEACSDRSCLIDFYQNHLGTLFISIAVDAPVARYRGEKNSGNEITMIPLGEGWYVVQTSSEYLANVRFLDREEGVMKVTDGKAIFREHGGNARLYFRKLPGDRWAIRQKNQFSDSDANLNGAYSRFHEEPWGE